MVLQIKSPILGFESLQSVVLKEMDDTFSTLHTTNDSDISFTILNPFKLIDDYDIEIPDSIKMKLSIEDGDTIAVYCMVVTQEPIKNSVVNFLAPIIINISKNTLAQVTLNPQDYSHLGIQDPISKFVD
jgi:flagellar assembly factor FliW